MAVQSRRVLFVVVALVAMVLGVLGWHGVQVYRDAQIEKRCIELDHVGEANVCYKGDVGRATLACVSEKREALGMTFEECMRWQLDGQVPRS